MMHLPGLSAPSANPLPRTTLGTLAPLQPLRQWLNQVEIRHMTQAHLICQLIPTQCPFERKIRLGNRIYLHLPPLCKLNPLYDEVVSLRYRALHYLAATCPDDVVRRYC